MIYLASRAPDCVRHVAARARAVVARGDVRGARRDSGGRFARPHAPRVAFARRAVALAVLALVLLVPSVARADIVNSPLPNTVEGLVAPYDFSMFGRFEAAGEVIGRSFSGLTSEQKHYILDFKNDGGNAFVDFGNQKLRNCAYESNLETDATYALFPFWTGAFDKQETWWWGYPNDVASFEAAQRDYDLAWQAYLDEHGYGGSSGSGTNPTIDGNYVNAKGVPIYNVCSAAITRNQAGIGRFTASGTTYTLTDPPVPNTTLYEGEVNYHLRFNNLSSYTDYDPIIFTTLFAGSQFNTSVLFFKKGSYEIQATTVERSAASYTNDANSTFSCVKYVVTTTEPYYHSYSKNLASNMSVVDGVLTVDNSSSNSYGGLHQYAAGTVEIPSNLSDLNDYGYFSASGFIAGAGDPVYPDPPQPPEIPEPDPPETRPIDDPGITLPPINFPDLVLPDIDYTVETPTGTDVIPYLKKIIANQQDIAAFLSDAFDVLDRDLDNIGSALGEHCNHLQTQMQKQAYWLATELQDMFDGLEVGISNYLYRVQTKLLQGIGWEFDNLSQDVISWLKRIYSRLGGNGISKPDPTTDPVGFWDWLIKQFSDFFEDLFGKSTDGLSSLFDSLKEFFPFSLPWDILALLGLFVHEPVTPVFDLPMPVPSIVSDSRMYLIHVDCHPWDGTMQIVRVLEFVFFAYHLMRMVPSWFNEIKVSGM